MLSHLICSNSCVELVLCRYLLYEVLCCYFVACTSVYQNMGHGPLPVCKPLCTSMPSARSSYCLSWFGNTAHSTRLSLFANVQCKGKQQFFYYSIFKGALIYFMNFTIDLNI